MEEHSAETREEPLLSGVRVVEFTEYVAGPFAGRMLADLGADVIKIDPVTGDPWRRQQAVNATEGRAYIASNRGKRCLALDLRADNAQDVIARLARYADIVLVNLRQDSAERFGITWERLSAINPRLVYGQVTALGPDGPLSDQPGFDLVGLAASGLLAAEGKLVGGFPAPLAFPGADSAAASAMATGVLAALYRREQTGRGSRIATSLLHAMTAVQAFRLTFVGDEDEATRQRVVDQMTALRATDMGWDELYSAYMANHGGGKGNIYYRAYRTADGDVVLGALIDRQRGLILQVLGVEDPRYRNGALGAAPPGADIDGLVREVEALFRTKTSAEWIALFGAVKVPIVSIVFPEELPVDPHAVATRVFAEFDHPVLGPIRTPGMAILTDTPALPRGTPGIGEHTDAILEEIGYDAAGIARLREAKTVA
jgi:formyl-CoA transferase